MIRNCIWDFIKVTSENYIGLQLFRVLQKKIMILIKDDDNMMPKSCLQFSFRQFLFVLTAVLALHPPFPYSYPRPQLFEG